jgi:orotidine-5'-phosphate decarboxylase
MPGSANQGSLLKGATVMNHFADRLIQARSRKGTPACVGFDPQFEHIPEQIRARHGQDACKAILAHGRGVLEIVAPLVPVVKINIGFFEPFRGAGVDAYFELVRAARELGLLVIGDVKRGDIGHTSTCYANAHLAGRDAPDAVTVNAYFGIDGVKPFLDVARKEGRGVFVLVHTSNPSAGRVQHLQVSGAGSVADSSVADSSVADSVADMVNEWAHAEGMVGVSGVSAVGAVVAPDEVERARSLRKRMPDSVFLVPGFGAQGRSVEQVAACFHPDGGGALVNSSRGVIFAHQEEKYRQSCGGSWERCVEQACKDFVAALRGAIK